MKTPPRSKPPITTTAEPNGAKKTYKTQQEEMTKPNPREAKATEPVVPRQTRESKTRKNSLAAPFFRECLLLALSLSAAQASPGEEDETGRPVPSRVEGWGWCRRLEVSDSHKKHTFSPGTYWLKIYISSFLDLWEVFGE
jgi:hypothetical protein